MAASNKNRMVFRYDNSIKVSNAQQPPGRQFGSL